MPAFIKTEQDLIDALPNSSVRFIPMSGGNMQQADWDAQMEDEMEEDEEEGDSDEEEMESAESGEEEEDDADSDMDD